MVDYECNRTVSEGAIALGRNRAIERATGDLIIVLDAGCHADQFCFQHLYQKISEGYDLVGGLTCCEVANKYTSLLIKNDRYNPSSRNIVFRKTVWESIGGYSTAYYTGEDTDFNIRIRNKGYNIGQANGAIVFWNGPTSYEDFKIKMMSYGMGDGKFRNFYGKYLFRYILLLLPIYYIIFFNTKSYFGAWAYQMGYLRGLRRSDE